ncbi:MAG: hypothetical protein ACI814_004881, partial [Mariniblastus sp.]
MLCQLSAQLKSQRSKNLDWTWPDTHEYCPYCVSEAIGSFVRVAAIWPKNMLHDARMAGLAKLRRSIRSTDERQLRAVK